MTATRPAIQTIPKPDDDDPDEAANFRKAFTPPPGYSMLVGDFDQFEMRLVAAEAGEEHLIRAFKEHKDTHSVTALRTMEPDIRRAAPEFAKMSQEDLLHSLESKVDALKKFRGYGKVLNFAIVYGATEWGVSRLAGVSVTEARRLIDAFHAAYPALADDIRKTRARITAFSEESWGSFTQFKLTAAQETRISNRVGIIRSFELPLRLIQILMRLAESHPITKRLPVLDRWLTRTVRYYDADRTPDSIVRSQLRSAARKLQGYVHRQAYNFRIQSLGSFYTKQLQLELARSAIEPGMHCAADLQILPGINVHDEIHLYSKVDPQSAIDVANSHAKALSKELGVPIVFELAVVQSWADKA